MDGLEGERPMINCSISGTQKLELEDKPAEGLPCWPPQVSRSSSRCPFSARCITAAGGWAGMKTSSSRSSAPWLVFIGRKPRWGDEAEERGGRMCAVRGGCGNVFVGRACSESTYFLVLLPRNRPITDTLTQTNIHVHLPQ